MKKTIYISVATVAVILIVAGHQACKKGDNAFGFLSPSGSLKTTVEQLNLKDRFGNNIFDDITYDPDSNLMVIIDRGDKVEFMGRDEKNTLKEYAQLGLYFVGKYNRNLIPNLQRSNPTVLYRISNGEATVVEVELLKDDYNACEKMHMTDDSITCRRIGLKLDLVPKPFAIGNSEVSYLEELGVDLQCTKTQVEGNNIIFYVHINGWPGALSGIVAKLTGWTKKLIIKYLVDTESRQKDLKIVKDYGLNVVVRFYGFDSSDYSEMVIKPIDWGGEQPAQPKADPESDTPDTSSILHPQLPVAED